MYFGGNDFEDILKFLLVMLVIFGLLGVWKLIDIGVWLYKHVNIGVV